ncbi:MAG: bifunctional phosphoglucose/phosphomannose isomerase [Candidatus Thermoplasmatota archaeon]|nr:bifunctional phosphoglucose/phosphomannose isomerase [Candidatus Thermoplasmatota archaeon]MCL5438218.1 bifunctional phosphoglucose/phosphomannose isomerase [Candidatus Thermoplasmatota archaeon]
MNFLDEILSFRDQLKFDAEFKLDDIDYGSIVYVGMGGSSVPGMIFSRVYSEKPFTVWNDYGLPDHVPSDSLVIAVSYSGNTEETISSVNEARNRGLWVIGMGTGGKLKEMCNQWVDLPSGYQPRSSLGFILTVLVRTFLGIGSLGNAQSLIGALDNENGHLKDIAEKIVSGKRIPLIYSFHPYDVVAYRWKTQFNENSKLLAYTATFPELDHNEIVGLSGSYGKENLHFLVLGKSENERIQKRIGLTMDLTGTEYDIIEAKGNSVLERMLYLTHCGDYISLYAAQARGIDPEDVSVITRLKNSLQ